MASLKMASLAERAQDAIMRIIQDMDLAVDNKLPREEALAEQLGVSRTTIRQALNNLAAEGVVSRRQGRGTFVNAEAVGVRVTFSPCMELMQAIRNSGYEPSVRLLNSHVVTDGPHPDGDERMGTDIVHMLQLGAGERLVEHDKVFLADGRPCAFCRDYFGESAAGGPDGLGELERYQDSLYRFVYERSGRRVEWDRAEIGVALVREMPASFDRAVSTYDPTHPLLCIRSLNYDQDSRPVVYAVEYIDASIIRYNLVRRKAVDYSRS